MIVYDKKSNLLIGEMMELRETERIDDLQYKGLKIIQNRNGFCFGIDAVLLADFAKKIKENMTVIDLCTGTGIVAILIAGKTKASKIYAVEIQEEVAKMAQRSVKMNHLEMRIEVLNQNLLDLKEQIQAGSIDVVTVNPPYKAKNTGLINEADTKTIARHEISCNLEDIVKECSRVLKTNGSMYMVHRPERLVDILTFMRKYKVEPKRMRFIHPMLGKEPNLVLIEGVRCGNPFLMVEKPLYVYNEKGGYTREIKQIYQIELES